jgi:hypothetical protein
MRIDMDRQKNIEERLWNYIDGTCSLNEKLTVKKLIANEERWNRKYHELTGVHQLISGSLELEEPSPGFLQKANEKISAID